MTKYKTLCTDIQFPEGPAFDSSGNLWVVDKDKGSIISLNKKEIQIINTGGCPNGIAINDQQQVVFCDSGENSVRVYDPSTKELYTLCMAVNGETLKMPNDLAFDQRQQLVFSCPGDNLNDPCGYICVYNNNGILYKFQELFSYPNGLAFSKDGSNLFVAETGKRQIWKGDWDAATGRWNNPQVFTRTAGPENGGPDGIAIDEKGWVYAAIYGSGLVQGFNEAGKLLKQWQLPGKYPTNLAFVPVGHDLEGGLVVTEVETGSVIFISRE